MKRFKPVHQSLLMFLLLSLSYTTIYGQGSRFSGSYTSSGTITRVGESNFVIEGVEIAADGTPGIALYNCENVIIRNSKISPSPLKPAVYLYNCSNVTVEDCTFDNVQSGLLASTSRGIKFEYNDLTNIVGGLKGSPEVGVMAQFIQVTGAGNSISYNACENFPGESAPEDLVNLSQSQGTADSPILVRGNWIRGGGPSASGGGINLGDLGGAYQLAEENILVNPGQYGVAISGGSHMTLRNNQVYAERQSFTNVGMVAANWYENELGPSTDITVANNRINYTNSDGAQNSWWFAQNMEPVIGKETNLYDRDVTASSLPDQIIGRAALNIPPPTEEPPTEEPPVEEPPTEEPPTVEWLDSPLITIYLDSYNHICVNTRGKINKDGLITLFDLEGSMLLSIPIEGYHTVLDWNVEETSYIVSVVNGKWLEKQLITIN